MAKKRKFYKRLFIVPIASIGLFGTVDLNAENTSPLKILHQQKSKEGYVVNFNNVPMTELLKFISKIAKTNFVYEPQDLQFAITFTSEEPTSLENIMSTFSQILRIHGLSLMEESNNLVIHKNPAVKQISDLVITEQKDSIEMNNFLITRVFNIYNANPKNIEIILTQMISTSAILSVIPETRQIILMDIPSNISKAAELISYLDTPTSNLEIRSYKFKNANPESSSLLLKQLITPISEGNPVILAPQPDANTLFIVSTPYLLQKSTEILMQLDQVTKGTDKNISLENIFLYKIKYKSFANIQKALKEVVDNAKKQGFDTESLKKSIDDARFISSTNSIVFVGDKNALDKLKSLITSIDDAPSSKQAENNKFFIYEGKNKTAEQIYQNLKEIEKHLIASHLGDPNLITCLENMKFSTASNTIIFTGDTQSIEEVTNLLKTIDISQGTLNDQFLIYTPLYLSPQSLMDSLKQVSKNLTSNGLSDAELIKSIDTAKYVSSSFSLVFTGSKETLLKVRNLLDELDTVNKRSQIEDNMLIYKLKFVSKKMMDDALETYAETLPIDSPIHETIEQRSFLPQSSSFVFKGSQSTLDRLKQIIDLTDTSGESKDQVYMYKIQNQDDSLVIENLKTYIEEVPHNTPLYESLKNYKYVSTSRIIIFKGTSDTIKQIQTLLPSLDNISSSNLKVLNYKVQSSNLKLVLDNLKKVQSKLNKTDPLYEVLKNAQVIEDSHLIIFKGTDKGLLELSDILEKIDVKDTISSESSNIQVVYNIKNISYKQLSSNLQQLEESLKKESSDKNIDLINVIKNIQFLKDSNSIILIGQNKSVNQLLTLIKGFDISEVENKNRIIVLNYSINSENPEDIVQKLKNYVQHINTSQPNYDSIKNFTYLPSSKMLVFQGSEENLASIKTLMSELDPVVNINPELVNIHSIYTIKSSSKEKILKYLESIRSKLAKENDPTNTSLIKTLSNLEWESETNSFYISGTKKDVSEVINLLTQFDKTETSNLSNNQILNYKIKNSNSEAVVEKLKLYADSIPSTDSLYISLKSFKYIPSSKLILFKGNETTLNSIQALMSNFDSVTVVTEDSLPTRILYNFKSVSADKALKYLDTLRAKIAKNKNPDDQTLLQTLSSIEWVPETNSLYISGSKKDVNEALGYITQFDSTHDSDQTLNYKIKSPNTQEVLDKLKLYIENMGSEDPLYTHLKNFKYIPSSKLIIFKGNDSNLASIQTLMNNFDSVTAVTEDSLPTRIVYNLKSVSGDKAIKYIDTLRAKIAKNKNPEDQTLLQTLSSIEWVPETNSLYISGSKKDVNEALGYITQFDSTKLLIKDSEQTLNYKIKNPNSQEVLEKLKSYIETMGPDDPLYSHLKNFKYIPTSNLLIFKGTNTENAAIENLMATLDAYVTPTEDSTITYSIYTLKNTSEEKVTKYLDKIKQKLKKDPINTSSGLLQSISSVEWVPETHSFYITGNKHNIDQVINFISQVDNPTEEKSSTIYQLSFISGDSAISDLKSLAKGVNDPNIDPDSFAKTIQNIEWVKSSNSLFISGKKSEIVAIESLLKGIDNKSLVQNNSLKTEFIIYKPTNISAKDLKKSLDKVTSDLEQTQLSDPLLLQALKGIKLSDHNQSIVITGNETSIKKVKDILATIDIPSSSQIETNFFNYKTKHMSAKNLKDQLIKIVDGITGDPDIHDPVLVKMVHNAQVVDATDSLIFTGSPATTQKIEQLITTIDVITTEEQTASANSNFFIYKPQKATAKTIKKSLENLSQDFEKTGLADSSLIRALRTSRLNDAGNSVIFSGSPDTIEKIKSLLTTIDVTGKEGELINDSFYLYKAVNQSPSQVQTNLINIAEDLEKSGLTDTRLIQTIKTSKVIESSSSIAFTGDPATLNRLKDLIISADSTKQESGIQHIGQTTFMIYKIKAANPNVLMESLKSIGSDLSKSKSSDKELLKCIDNMRYVKETNSIVFTGPSETLNKVTTILEKFDLPTEIAPAPSRISTEEYSLYSPINLNGDELIKTLQDFESSLNSSGVKDHRLFDCVSNLKWMQKTSSIIISGDKETVSKVLELLKRFDVPSRNGEKKADVSIETIEDVSFLIYKVQYHEGNSILDAIQGIGNDLKSSTSVSTQALVKAIKSLQFVKVTNSLIATGDPKILARLKELIQSVDVPLKQVFIEVLVIETDLSNILQFGLRWGAQGSYKNRLGFSTSSLDPSDNQSSGLQNNFAQSLQSVSATTPPHPGGLTLPGGGSLGVIGDLIFHNGSTYIALGDFVNALQSDNDSTIVLNQKVITQDNKPSTLFVGSNIPYNGSVVTNQTQTTTTTANIEYMDVGINLEITPKVGEDNVITLDINQSISEQVGNNQGSTVSTSTVYGIQTRKTTLTTSVSVPNEHFVVLTGQIRNSSNRNKSAIPCLGGLPFIGAAFSDNQVNKQVSNIVMFLKPHIVNTYEEYKRITEMQENIYREQSVEEDFDQGLELVKSPDDK